MVSCNKDKNRGIIIMSKNGKNIGWAFFCLVPLVASIVLQVVAAIGFSMIVFAVKAFEFSAGGAENLGAMQQQITEFMTANIIWSVTAYQVIGIIVFSLWYYNGCGRKKLQNPAKVFNLKIFGGTVLAGVAIELVTLGVLYTVNHINPQILKSYAELMHSSQVGGFGIVSFITTVILAPIGEEILCRGVIMYYAKRATTKFWVANIIQAAAFGIIHLNIVQGLYAFAMGIAMGWFAEKYGSLLVPMVMHFAINLSATIFGVEKIVGFVFANLFKTIGIAVLGAGLLALAIKLAGKRKLPLQQSTQAVNIEDVVDMVQA